MRNYELIKEIYELCNREPDVGSGEIMNIIEKERPRIADEPSGDDSFWEGGYLPPKTHAEWMEEMKKYPHQDNHMD